MRRPLHDTCSPQPYNLTHAQRVSLGKGSSKVNVSIIRTVV